MKVGYTDYSDPRLTDWDMEWADKEEARREQWIVDKTSDLMLRDAGAVTETDLFVRGAATYMERLMSGHPPDATDWHRLYQDAAADLADTLWEAGEGVSDGL